MATGSARRNRTLNERLDRLESYAAALDEFRDIDADRIAARLMYDHGIAGPKQYEQLFPGWLEDIRRGILQRALMIRKRRALDTSLQAPSDWSSPVGFDPAVPWIASFLPDEELPPGAPEAIRLWLRGNDFWRKKGLFAIITLGAIDGMPLRRRLLELSTQPDPSPFLSRSGGDGYVRPILDR